MLAGRTKNLRNIICKALHISTANKFLNKVQNMHSTIYQEGYNKFEQVCRGKNDVFMYRFLFS